MRKIWDIHGGVHPPENKTQSNARPIASIALPRTLTLPLNQHIGAPAEPVVAVGDHVLKGERIARAQGAVSASVHASTSGTVVAIEARPIPHPSGLSAPCIVIESDGEDRWGHREALPDWQNAEPATLLQHIRQAGIAGMGGAGFPAAVKLKPREDQHINTLILNGTECEPYITADDMLMRERAAEIIGGVDILSHLLGEPQEVLIGIEDNKPEAIEAMRRACEGTRYEVVVFPTKYPSGGEKQLIQIVTGKEVPVGRLPADIGIVVQNVGTAAAVHRAVVLGEPLISRVTTVVGEALNTQQNIDVLIGTPISHVLEQHGFDSQRSARLIVGGPMMGYALEHPEVPVIKTTNCLLLPSREEMPLPEPAQPCIRCGMCAEACPASLLPQQLYWFSRAEDFDRLESHNLFDCIECGACSYVCPSNIPLVQYYRASKGAIRQHQEEKRKAEHSRQRFEFRKARMERAEAEKEAKRLARKKAAEAAKQKVAAQKSAPPAAAPTKPAEQDPDKQRAKLERALSSAQSRRDRAKQSLEKAQEEQLETARIDALTARLKEAEVKVTEAEKKLQAFQAEGASADTPAVPAAQIIEKVSASPREKLEKSLASLDKRLQAAKDKLAEAEAAQAPTVEALRQGVAKLEEKRQATATELEESAAQPETDNTGPQETATLSAAEQAIAKAQARAQSLAAMSPEEKAAAQIESLKKRLDKARARLQKAEQDGDDNIDAFRAGVEKLEAKLAASQTENTDS